MDTWSKTAAWALGATAVFSSMHVADELWSRWDIGETMVTSGLQAGVILAIPTIATLFALTGIVLARRWGFVVGIAVGLFALWAPLTHVLDSHGMTTVRWAIESLVVVSALVLFTAAGRELVVLRPASKARPAGL